MDWLCTQLDATTTQCHQEQPATTIPYTDATTTPYAMTQQEFLFVYAVILFILSVPFWERVLTIRKEKYRV